MNRRNEKYKRSINATGRRPRPVLARRRVLVAQCSVSRLKERNPVAVEMARAIQYEMQQRENETWCSVVQNSPENAIC
jgi:hypothetical protein